MFTTTLAGVPLPVPQLQALGTTVSERTNFDLVMDVSRGAEDTMYLALMYNAEVYGEGLMGRLGRYYVKAFEQMLEGLERPHRGQTLMSGKELEQLLVRWNATGVEYRRERCVHELIEEQAERRGEAEAVVFEGEGLSYGELNRRANRVAHYLREQGVGPDMVVGLCVERSLEMVVGMVGVLKAGGAYVPLEPGYPAERLEYMVADSGPAVVLTQAGVAERLGKITVPKLRLDQDGQQLEGYSAENVGREESGLKPEHLAYVIYTSGSTGRPKGVMVSHGNVVNFFRGMDEAIGCTAEDRMLAVTGISFDISGLELLWTLSCGAKVVIAGEMVQPAGQGGKERSERKQRSVAELGREHRPTLLQCTPSLMRMLQESGEVQEGLRGLRKLMLGGESLGASVVERVKRELGCEVVNMYGPTETTIWSTTGEVVGGGVISVGRPIANTELYIVDGEGVVVPVGTVGELWIGGEGVARGYLRRAELTAERFVPMRGSVREGGRCYRTGDLARYLEDGRVEIVGRNDFQVKVRGHRVELGEIEQRLGGMRGVEEAVVVAREEEGREKGLVAYVRLAEEWKEAGEKEGELVRGLREGLREQLPEHMVPWALVVVEKMPLTPNGKVDRKALPAPEGLGWSEEYHAPQTAEERAVAEIWEEVLKAEGGKISRRANFFELGGTR